MTDNLASPIVTISGPSSGGFGDLWSSGAQFSADGTKLMFVSKSNNLTSGDNTGYWGNLYVKTLATGAIERVNTDTLNLGGYVDFSREAFTPDGQSVIFTSGSSALIANDTNIYADIFIKNLTTDSIVRVNVTASGVQANDDTFFHQMSSDGTKVVFTSFANNLVAGDTNNAGDIFVKDLNSGALTRVSQTAGGVQGNGESWGAQFIGDGTRVAFGSNADNFDAIDPHLVPDQQDFDQFIKNLSTGAVTRVNVTSSGTKFYMEWLTYSPDGSKVYFVTAENGLVAGDTNGRRDLFVKDLATGTITRILVTEGGYSNISMRDMKLSADGSTIIFSSDATNLASGDNDSDFDFFAFDVASGQVKLICHDMATVRSDGTRFDVSADGSKIVFSSTAINLVTADINGKKDVFVGDVATGTVTRVSTTASGGEATQSYPDPGAQFISASDDGIFSPDGNSVVFKSYLNTLVPGDTNGTADLFLKSLVFTPVLPAAETLFATAGGKLLTFADFALAAYHLGNWEPVPPLSPRTNDAKPGADLAFGRVFASGAWTAMTATELGLSSDLVLAGGPFVTTLREGLYTNGNAAALVAKSADAVVLSFRGTNDNDAGLLPVTPDEDHWAGILDNSARQAHYDLLQPLIDAAVAYAQAHNIHKVYITGHSLGAAMVEGFMYEHQQGTVFAQDGIEVNFEAVAFASPGYLNFIQATNAWYQDSRITQFWNQDDVINGASDFLPNYGDKNRFFFDDGDDSILDGFLSGTQHAMTLYRGWIDFLHREGVESRQFSLSFDPGDALAPVDFDKIVAHVDFTNPDIGDFRFGLGANSLVGSLNGEILLGGEGNDTLLGAGGADRLYGGAGDDLISIVDENLSNLVGGDTIEGGAGFDTLDLSGLWIDSAIIRTNIVDLQAETATTFYAGYDWVSSIEYVIGSRDADSISGNGDANRFYGGNRNDTLAGRGGVDTLVGESGDDTLDGGEGTDRLVGGIGHDTYIVDNVSDQIIENAGEGTDTVKTTVSILPLAANVENLILLDTGNVATRNLWAHGNALANTITGNGGDNVIDGKGGSDTMKGGFGNDTYVTDGGDSIIEDLNAGTDTVQSSVTFTLGANIENLYLIGTAIINGTGNALANRLYGNGQANVLNGGGGNDTFSGGLGNDIYVLDGGDTVFEAVDGGVDTVQSSATVTLSANIENLYLTGTGIISATGNASANRLYGNGQANALNGGGGNDTMTGGDGNDTYISDGGDTIIEQIGGGIDTLMCSVSATLGATLEDLTLIGTAAINGTGNTAANRITGNGANNILNGGGGADILIGGLGNDTFVTDGGDRLYEYASGGIDTVLSSASCTLALNIENLTLTGTSAINGTGNASANTIIGNGAANILNGGEGHDILTGGLGGDRFVFATALNAATNVDQITDFSWLTDVIALENAVFTALTTTGALASSAYYAGAAAHDADDRILYNSATGSLSYDADGNGAGSAVVFARLGTGLFITSSAFLVV